MTGVVTATLRELDSDGPSHPAEWDERVADLADFVEEARDLEFDHPVHVDFLTPEEYTAATTTELATDAEEISALDRGVSQLRALGVVSGPLDLNEVLNEATDAGTLAFYSPEEERIRVRGTDVSVGLRVTLVHELTHALQDQHFDLGGLLDDAEDNSASVAVRGLGEGDALRVEEEFVDEALTDEERAAYDAEYERELEASQTATANVPAFIQATFATPYALGAPFVSMLYNDGGNGSIDAAFDSPPTTEEHLFDPASYLAEEESEDTDLGLGDDVEILEEGPFGSPSWYLVLAERIDPASAFTAALGWGGDAYAVFERDDTTCIRAVFRGDVEADEEQMGAALDAWAERVPGGLATRIDVDGHPGLEACDPGPDVDLQVSGNSTDVLVLPNVYGYLLAESVSDLGPEGGRCFATHVLDGLAYERLLDPGAQDELSNDVARRAVEAYVACGSGDR